jgi:predicted dehydrogenase
MTVRIAVLSVGQVGVKHIAAINKIEGAEAAAVVDLNEVNGKREAAACDAISHQDYKQQLDFVGAVEVDRSPWITGHDGRQSLALAAAIYQSDGEKRPVSLGQHDEEVYDG